jgi:hypothetical protein
MRLMAANLMMELIFVAVVANEELGGDGRDNILYCTEPI